MSMAKVNNTPCSSGSAACNPAESDVLSVADSDQNRRFLDDDWPRFLVIKSKDDKSIVKHNFFVISKAIQGIAGTVKKVTPQKKSDMILVQVENRQQSINLLDTDMLHDIPVEITAHRTMNSCKGVITCNFIEDLDDDTILANLKETHQKVQHIYRIISMRNGKKTPTHTFVVTFNQEKIPEKMYIGSHRVDVRQFIPNPRRCSHCQKFRHTKKFCKETDPICGKCGETGHVYENCVGTHCCVNCRGDHASSSRSCPVWKKEKDIVDLKFKEDISFPEAVQRIEHLYQNTSKSQSSYSAVVSSGSSAPVVKCTAGCQTDLTWPETLTSPVLTSLCVISDFKVVEVQTETVMELDKTNLKRARGESSSSVDNDLPSMADPPSKRNFNKLSVESVPRTDSVSLPAGDVAPGEGVVGGEGLVPDRGRSKEPPESGYPLPSPPPRACRTGDKYPGKSASGRSLSPIKHP